MSNASRKTRTIERKLKSVESMPIADENAFYMLTDTEDVEELEELPIEE